LNSDMALITSLIIFIALVFDFLLLPALLLYSNADKEKVQLNDPIKYKYKAA